jgi:hypothetical protein
MDGYTNIIMKYSDNNPFIHRTHENSNANGKNTPKTSMFHKILSVNNLQGSGIRMHVGGIVERMRSRPNRDVIEA